MPAMRPAETRNAGRNRFLRHSALMLAIMILASPCELEEGFLQRSFDWPQLADTDAGGHEPGVDLERAGGVGLEPDRAVLHAHRGGAEHPGQELEGAIHRLCPDQHAFLAEQLLHGGLGDELAAPDHADAVADLLDLWEQVAREQHGAIALADVLDELAHLGHALRVEPARGLVED